MVLIDVNVIVYAYQRDVPKHALYRQWLEGVVDSEHPYGMADIVLAGFLRVVTNPRIFTPPSLLESALTFANKIRSEPNCVSVAPGPRHWEIFSRLCRAVAAKGNLVPDAYLAALAIESGSEWITTDRDYSRFTGLRWRHPLE